MQIMAIFRCISSYGSGRENSRQHSLLASQLPKWQFSTASASELDFARLRGVAERVRHTLGEVVGEFLWVRAMV